MKFIDPLTDILPFTIQFYDRDFTILDMNQASVKVFRLKSKAEGIGQKLETINPGFMKTERPALYREVLDTGVPKILNAVLLNQNPETYYVVHAFRHQPGVLCLCSCDVTFWVQDQKERIRELENKNAQLQQFAYVASHDLQEPLRTLTSFVDLLEEDKTSTLSGEGKEFVRFIRNATGRMQTLIRDLLEYSRAGRWQPRRVDADIVLKDVLQDLESEIAATKAVVAADKLPEVHFDPTQLKQLFQNLLSNSLKFRRPEGPVRIAVTTRKVDGGLEIAFKDNGIGIDPKYHEKIFGLFQRLHSRTKFEGSGIGLSLCRRIMEGAGGRIRVESQPDRGTTFYVTIAGPG